MHSSELGKIQQSLAALQDLHATGAAIGLDVHQVTIRHTATGNQVVYRWNDETSSYDFETQPS